MVAYSTLLVLVDRPKRLTTMVQVDFRFEKLKMELKNQIVPNQI